MIDIFKPQISAVSRDLNGKTILVYGTNRVGKTRQLASLPKPCYLAFEAGIGAIAGVPYFPMRRWADFVSFVKQLTADKNIAQAREMYQTLILDQAEAMGILCEQYVCMKFGVSSLGERRTLADGKQDYGFNGYKEYGKEFEYNIRLLASVGFTVAFIAHEGTRKFNDENGVEYEKIYPKGDKRIIDPICDLVDIIAYASVNGLDENGDEIPSSLYLRQTRKYHAGSRFTHMAPYLKEFTADNLVQAIADAVVAEEQNTGIRAVSYEEQAQAHKAEDLPSYDDVKASITTLAKAVYDGARERYAEVTSIIEKHIGKGKSISKDTTPDQVELLCVVRDELRIFIDSDPVLSSLAG